MGEKMGEEGGRGGWERRMGEEDGRGGWERKMGEESCDSFGWFFATAQGRNDHIGQFQAELCHFSAKIRHSSSTLLYIVRDTFQKHIQWVDANWRILKGSI